MVEHLRPVPEAESEAGSEPESDTASGQSPTTGKRRAAQRPRTARAIPTDRMKFDMQVAALRAIAVASDYGKQAVGGPEIAPRIGVVPTTASLNNQYFMESGLITRVKKGHYKPTEAVNKFTRDHSFKGNKAGVHLAATLRETWYYREVERQLAMGETTVNQMVEILAHGAGATKDHQAQLLGLLGWLELGGLVSLEGDKLKLSSPSLTTQPVPPAPDPEPEGETPTKPPTDPASTGATKSQSRQGRHGEAVLSFSFDFSLTAQDLQGLSPEQIQATFEAVGKVMAIKAGIAS